MLFNGSGRNDGVYVSSYPTRAELSNDVYLASKVIHFPIKLKLGVFACTCLLKLSTKSQVNLPVTYFTLTHS